MVFSSLVFLFVFLPLVLLANTLLGRGPFKNVILLIASLVFYFWGELQYSIMMLISILMNYIFGLLVEKYDGHKKVKVVVGLAVAANLSLLIFFKYGNFIADNINLLLVHTGLPLITLSKIHLPIGISFFTFHSISYIVDIYRKEAPAEKSPVNLALYISFFPQLIAGPIIRYHDIADQIISRKQNLQQFANGVNRFISGLAKKVLIANTMAGIADQVFAIPSDQLTAGVAWIGIIAYTLQIYFDFSGYSDMAIGLAKMFGFEFLENFNYPYIATSIKDFWRRWHISLSNWFRDYLYIPLGGNRLGIARTYVNLIIVFFLTGLWHGASWSFIFWGLLHGLMLILERLGLEKILKRAGSLVSHIYTLFFVMIAWVFFRADNLGHAVEFLKSMFGMNMVTGTIYYFPAMFISMFTVAAFIAAVIFSTPVFLFLQKLWRLRGPMILLSRYNPLNNLALVASYGVLMILFSASVMALASGTYNPFIYFRF